MKRKTRTPILFIRDHDFETLLSLGAPRELAAARQDRAATWVCYDMASVGDEELAPIARLQCVYAHFHRIGPEPCPDCNTKQERTSLNHPKPQVVVFVAPEKAVLPEEERSALQRVVDDWE